MAPGASQVRGEATTPCPRRTVVAPRGLRQCVDTADPARTCPHPVPTARFVSPWTRHLDAGNLAAQRDSSDEDCDGVQVPNEGPPCLRGVRATHEEAQRLLGHSTSDTTSKYYLRAQDLKAHDPARTALRFDPTLTVAQRLDALWDAWVGRFDVPL